MRFLHGKLKAFTGEKIKVKISMPTRVLIMPERQFNKYRENMTYTYFGGQKDGEYEFSVPKSGTWVIVVEKGTYANPLDIEVNVSKEAAVPKAIESEKKSKKKKKKNKKEDENLEEVNEGGAENPESE